MKEKSIPNWLFALVVILLGLAIFLCVLSTNINISLKSENDDLHSFYDRFPSNIMDATKFAVEDALQTSPSGNMTYLYGFGYGTDNTTLVQVKVLIQYEKVDIDYWRNKGE